MRHRTGLILILAGLFLAAMTTVLVIRIANQAQEAGRSTIRQVQVVAASRDILDQTQIPADALTIKSFPADFVPPGALGSADEVVGKFANGLIARDQVIVARQVLPAQRSPNLSDRVPPGKVAIWLPMPELLAQANVLKPGDRLDILLTIPLAPQAGQAGQAGQGGGGQASALSTQTTLQNVEVFRLGEQEISLAASGTGSPSGQYGAATNSGMVPAQPAQGGQAGQAGQPNQAKPTGRAIGFLVDHQDAVIIKFIKDSGGTIDLALRSVEEQQIVRTDAVTLDSVTERFRFRVPQPAVSAQAATR
jgi:pilus assembly protein CpaB